jgi:hypothetical protein
MRITFKRMQIIVNHLTRMKSQSRICLAGVDAATFQHVRPVTPATDLLTRELLRENGGPFGVGALVDLGEVQPCPNPPESEDHSFTPAQASAVEDLQGEVYLELLRDIGVADPVAGFGPELHEIRAGKFAVCAGEGQRSLAVMPLEQGELRMRFGNLYLHLDTPHARADVRVTDVRFYEPDHTTIRRSVVEDVNSRLKRGVEAHLMMGLARPLEDKQAGEVQWLMANGLCLADRPVTDEP